MRISLRGLADLTNVNSMLLPAFGPNLPAAPTYSGGISGLGLGQASCPSLEQLEGIQDCSDPCQASAAPCIATGTTTTAGATNLATATALAACSAAGGIWNSNGTCSASTGAAAPISSSSMLWIGGGFLALILLVMVAKK